MMNWRNCIKYSEQMDVLISALIDQKHKGESNALMSGLSGRLLSEYYRERNNGGNLSNHLHNDIECIFEQLNSGFSYPTFAGGLSGICWSLHHLIDTGGLEADLVEPLLGLDQFFLQHLEYEFLEKKHYDYLHGGLGYHITMMNSHLRDESIRKTLSYLDKTALRMEDGIAWLSCPTLDSNEQVINLSLSHGIASIIQILSKTYKHCKGEELKKCEELLNGAVSYMLSKKQNQTEVGSFFPSWVSNNHVPSYSRLAWCYGDLGIAMALLQAGINTNNEQWEETATEILLQTAKRRNLEENLVKDAGLCHGTSGIAHCFNRAYNYTGNEEFKETAAYWFDETLKMAVHADGLAGFKAWRTETLGGWTNESGLLEGVAGIGLSLISASVPIEPKWDECLLLS